MRVYNLNYGSVAQSYNWQVVNAGANGTVTGTILVMVMFDSLSLCLCYKDVGWELQPRDVST